MESIPSPVKTHTNLLQIYLKWCVLETAHKCDGKQSWQHEHHGQLNKEHLETIERWKESELKVKICKQVREWWREKYKLCYN